MNSMIKSLMYITIALFMGSCSKTIVPVVDFTPRLKAELDQADLNKFAFKTQQAKVQNSWNAGDFVNQGNSNFAIEKFSHKFSNLSLKLPHKIITDPLMNNNQMFILDEKNNLVSYDLKDDKIQWQISLQTDSAKKIVVGGLSVDNQRLYVTNGSRNIYILDRLSGYKIGQIILEDVIFSAVTVDNKNIYALVANNNLWAFDKNSLNSVWNLQGQSNDSNLLLNTFTTPIVKKDKIISEFYTGQLVAVDKTNGKQLWEHTFVQNAYDASDMRYVNLSTQGIVEVNHGFFASSYGVFSKIDLRNGKVLWQKNITDILGANKFGNLIVLTTNAQELVGLSADDGKILWVTSILDQKRRNAYNLLTPLMINDDLYVISSAGKLYKLDKKGALLETIDIVKDVNFYAVYGQKIYLFTKNQILLNTEPPHVNQ